MIKRCSKCVEPESAPHITFDEQGVCNYCKTHKNFSLKGEEALKTILDSCKQKGGKYDCIVALSGGRDSSYVLLKAVKDYGLKVLAVNYCNPFTDPQALKNIENAVKILDVDLVSIEDKNDAHKKTFKNNVKAWFKKPSAATVGMVCIGCKSMWLGIIKTARQYDIQCIISGGNRFEEISFKKELVNVSHDEERENKFKKALVGVITEVSKNPGFFHPICIPTMIKGYLFANEYCPGSKILGYNMDRIQLFDYIPWDEDEVISRISSELKWDYPKKLHSTWRFDCRIGHIRDYMYLKTLQMTERDDLYAKMVREGVITRTEALERLEMENKIHYDEIKDLLNSVGIMDTSFIEECL
ncbi:MAG: ATPase [Desulfuromonas sp. SDB]|nr:MAG: ATPase [Desulfuromonas sp. SDB]